MEQLKPNKASLYSGIPSGIQEYAGIMLLAGLHQAASQCWFCLFLTHLFLPIKRCIVLIANSCAFQPAVSDGVTGILGFRAVDGGVGLARL